MVAWVTASFAVTQGASWELSKLLGQAGVPQSNPVTALFGIWIGAPLLITTLLLAIAHAYEASTIDRAARFPTPVEGLDATGGRIAFRAIQTVTAALIVVWPIYALGHFESIIWRTQVCSEDLKRKISIWTFTLEGSRFGVVNCGDEHIRNAGVSFLTFIEPGFLTLLLIIAVGLSAWLGYLVLFAESRGDS
jgi:hypothetical protein